MKLFRNFFNKQRKIEKNLVVSEFRNGCRYVMSKKKFIKTHGSSFFWLCKFVILKVGGLFLRAGGYWLQFHIFFLPLIWWFISFVGFYHFVHSTFFLSNLKHFLSLMLLFFILFLSCSPHRLTNSEFLISNFHKFQNQSDDLLRNIEIQNWEFHETM